MTTELSPSQLSELANDIAHQLAERLEKQKLLDYAGLADWLGVSIATVERLKRQSEIPYVSVGRRVLFDKQAVLSALSQQGANRE